MWSTGLDTTNSPTETETGSLQEGHVLYVRLVLFTFSFSWFSNNSQVILNLVLHCTNFNKTR